MKSIEYKLEVYAPGSVRDVRVTFEASSPFMPLGVGDILNPTTWPGTQSPMKVLRVTQVEHIIWENDGQIWHKVMVYSDEIDNIEAARR